MRLDYGVAHVSVSRGRRTVTGTCEIIGVGTGVLARWESMGVLVGDTLTLDTDGVYVYRLLGPSAHTPGVTRYKRVRGGGS